MAIPNVKQIRTTHEQHELLINIAKSRKGTLREVANEALSTFLNRRDRVEGLFQEYFSSASENSACRSYRFDDKLINRVKAVAKRDSVSENRVIYTSIFLYCKKHKDIANS